MGNRGIAGESSGRKLMSMIITLVLTAAVSALVTLTVVTNMDDDTAGGFRGVYVMDDGTALSLLQDADDEAPFYIYKDMQGSDDDVDLIMTGTSKPAGENIVTLYGGNGDVFGEVVYSDGKYYYIQSGMEPEEIERTDDGPVIPAE